MAAICPIEISPDDRLWIDAIRARHDPSHGLVPPHFTLIFPTEQLSEAEFVRHVEKVADDMPAIAFRLSSAQVVPDSLSPRTHVFLMPDEGDEEIRRLHHSLYSGPLEPGPGEDIPFHPHVTVAVVETQDDAEAVSKEIGSFEISGWLREVALVSISRDAVALRCRIPLH